MTRSNRQIRLILALSALLVLLVSACAPDPTDPADTPLPEETLAATEMTSPQQETAAPTATPDSSRVILVTGEAADADLAAAVQSPLESLAAEAGLVFMAQPNLTADELTPGVKVVVSVGGGVDLAALAAAAPGTQFVGIRNPGLSPGSNVSVLGEPGADQQRLSFMAGYLAALVSDDYKIAGLVAAGDETGGLAADSFVIGARFYCGLCQPKYPPYGVFPKWESFAPGSGANVWSPIIDALVSQGVEIVYVHSAVATPALFSYLSDQGVKLISDTPSDVQRNNWVGTLVVDPEPALRLIWPDLMAGAGGFQTPLSVRLTDTDAGLVSEGRYRLFEEMLAELEAGMVLPEPVP
jgi:hypothetical protein